jgi:pyruvate, water dikinase
MSVLRLLQQFAYRVFSPTTVVREKYSAFKDLLEQDHQAHKAMARIEKIYHDRLPVDFSAVRHAYEDLVRALTDMSENLKRMAPFSYKSLPETLRSIDRMARSSIGAECMERSAPLVLPLSEIPLDADRLVGGKAAGLSRVLLELKLPVPKGFVITSHAFFEFVAQNRLHDEIEQRLAVLDIHSATTLEAISREIVSLIMGATIPETLDQAMKEIMLDLRLDTPCAVRSSGVGEDGTAVSFAGQYLTRLNVNSENVAQAYKEVVASRYSPAALAYRIRNGLLDEETPMAVLVLEMVDCRASGVLYTRDPVALDSIHMVIYSICGVGEPLVGGTAAPDIIRINRDNGLQVLTSEKTEGTSKTKVAASGGIVSAPLNPHEKKDSSLDEHGARQLAAWGHQLESYFGLPQDIEWCEDRSGNRFILQSRPLRLSSRECADFEGKFPEVPNPILLSGGEKAASGVAMGRVARLDSSSNLKHVPYGSILVAGTTLPQYAQLIGKIKGIVTDTGSAAGHVASVAREAGIPCLVNTGIGTEVLKRGETVTLDADRQVVYAGIAEELLAFSADRKQAPTETPLGRRLRNLLDSVSPLNLVDPGDPGFVLENCRTLHDVLRYVHEKAVQDMFDLAGSGKRKFRGAKKLSADIPIVLYVLDLGGGLRQSAARLRTVTPEDVSSFPFKALWRGLISLPESWHSDVLHFDWWNLDRFSLGEGIVSFDSQLLGSFALVSPDYMNVNARFGLHFAIIDAFIGPTARDNYVSLRFKGGGAEFEGKHLRALFLAQVFENHGFNVHLDRDSVSATAERAPAAELEEKLEVIGRLLAFTPLLDMTLEDLSEVSRLAAVFSKPPAHPKQTLPEGFTKGDLASDGSPRSGDDIWMYRPNWLTDHLAIGHAPMSYEELASLKKQGIGAIVNLCAEYPDLARIEKDFGFEVLYLPVPDDHAPEMEEMDKVLGWMDEAIYLGKKVLIHCRLGVGRTGTFLRSYLIRRGFGSELTEEKLKRVHSHPTSNSQWKLLRRYGRQAGRLTIREPSLEAERAVDLCLYFEEYEALCRAADEALESPTSDGSDQVQCCGRDTDACCKTFFHLQFMEAVYLWHHLVKELSREDRTAVTRRAVEMDKALTTRRMSNASELILLGAQRNFGREVMNLRNGPEYVCPLSVGGRCLLFSWRPIRCRLLGPALEAGHGLVSAKESVNEESEKVIKMEGAAEALYELSRGLFFALNGGFLEGRSLIFPITRVVSGKYVEHYFSVLSEMDDKLGCS